MARGTPGIVPDDGLTTKQRRNRLMVIVSQGKGKGKSTATSSLALRGRSQGWSIRVFQFVKSAKQRIGEQTALEVLGKLHGEISQGGVVGRHKVDLEWSWTRKIFEDDPARAARDGWEEVRRRLAEQTHGLCVLDEPTYPTEWDWVDTDKVVETLANRPGFQHVVVTGRRCPEPVLELASLVTNMTKIKRPFGEDQKGQKGIER